MAADRQDLARMYMSSLRDAEGEPWPTTRIDQHLGAMDFTKEVRLRKLRGGEDYVERFGKRGEESGNYFAPLGSDQMQLGIRGEATMEARQRDFFRVTRDLEVLEFTARDIDSWQRYPKIRDWKETDQPGPPPPFPSGELFYGGGKAYLVADTSGFERVFQETQPTGCGDTNSGLAANAEGIATSKDAEQHGIRRYTVDGQDMYLTPDGKPTTEKPFSMMTYEERFQAQGLVEHRGSEKQIENWVEGIQQGQRVYEILRDNATAGETVASGEGIKAAVNALGDVVDAGLRAKEKNETNEFVREKHPTYEVYRDGGRKQEPLPKKPEQGDSA